MNRFVHNKRRLGLNSLFKLPATLKKPANVFEMLKHVRCLKCLRVCSAELWAGRAVCLLGGVCVVWQAPRSSRCWIKILAGHCWHCMHTRNGLINSAPVKGKKGVKKEGKGLWTHWQSTLTLCLLETTQHAPYLQLTLLLIMVIYCIVKHWFTKSFYSPSVWNSTNKIYFKFLMHSENTLKPTYAHM